MLGEPKRILRSPRAQRDLLDIWRYFARVASPEVADTLLRDIDGACRRLQMQPLLGRSRDEVMPGLRSVLVHPYSIFYRVQETSVQIVRVLHERRDVAALFPRKRR